MKKLATLIAITVSVLAPQSFAAKKSSMHKIKGAMLYTSCQLKSCIENGKECSKNSDDYLLVSKKMDLFLNLEENSNEDTVLADETVRTLLYFDDSATTPEMSPRLNGPMMIRESALEKGSAPISKKRQLATSFTFLKDPKDGDVEVKIQLQMDKSESEGIADQVVAIYSQKQRAKTATYTCLNYGAAEEAFD